MITLNLTKKELYDLVALFERNYDLVSIRKKIMKAKEDYKLVMKEKREQSKINPWFKDSFPQKNLKL